MQHYSALTNNQTKVLYVDDDRLGMAVISFLYTGEVQDRLRARHCALLELHKNKKYSDVAHLSDYARSRLVAGDLDLDNYDIDYFVENMYDNGISIEHLGEEVKELREKMMRPIAEELVKRFNLKDPELLQESCEDFPEFGQDMLRWLAEAEGNTYGQALGLAIEAMSTGEVEPGRIKGP